MKRKKGKEHLQVDHVRNVNVLTCPLFVVLIYMLALATYYKLVNISL